MADVDTQLEDLLAFYPDSRDPHIQEIISSKKEFRDLASHPFERLQTISGQKRYYNHQLLSERLLRALDALMYYHETGTGKTYLLRLLGESFHRARQEGGHIRKILVLVRSDILGTEVERQLMQGFLPEGQYLSDSYKRKMRRQLEEWYEIVGFKKFARSLSKKEDAAVIDEYSNTLIFFDEAHNTRFEEENINTQKIRLGGEFRKKKVYDQLYRVFHLPQNTKRVIATATPMVNDVNELGPLLNLILPFDHQFPSDYDFETATLSDLEPYFRGRISYVRSLDTGIEIIHYGINPKEITGYEFKEDFDPQFNIYPSEMSHFQKEAYMQAQSKNGSHSREGEKKRKKTFYHEERQASNFVYPDGRWGSKAFKDYTEKVGTTYYAKSQLQKVIASLKGIRRCSCKYAQIIEIAEAEDLGNVYVYDNFVEASGAITLALCFQAMGYEIFRETKSVFYHAENGERIIRDSFPKKKRIAILTGMTSSNTFVAMNELMNSPENRHGDYIKVFITSPTGNEGINVNNVTSIHLVGGNWKQSTIYQAVSRALRSTSHVDLLKELQDDYLRRGVDPRDARIPVKIYYHAAIAKDDNARVHSIDLHLYTLAEIKDRSIRRVQRFMKQTAIDAQIHYERNVRPTDTFGTIQSDYGDPEYECYGDVPTEIDYSTYDVYYAPEATQIIMGLIKRLFETSFSLTIREILCFIERQQGSLGIEPRKKYIHWAIQQMMEHKTTIKDRYGYSCFLAQEGDTLFLIRDYPVEHLKTEECAYRFTKSYYTSHIIASHRNCLRNIRSSVRAEKDVSLIQKLQQAPLQSRQFEDLLHTINTESLASVLEGAIATYVDCQERRVPADEFSRCILYRLGLHNAPGDRQPSLYYRLPEPLTEIRKFKQELMKKEQGRGRKPKSGIRKIRLKHYNPQANYEWDPSTPEVYIHILYTLQKSRTRYDKKKRYFKVDGRIRIFKVGGSSSSRGWRDASPEEAVVYSLWVQSKLLAFREFFEEQSPVYGYYLGDQELTIRNRIGEDPGANKDKRKRKAGRVCKHIQPPTLVKILEFLHVESYESWGDSTTREWCIEKIIATKGFRELESEIHHYSDERLRYVAGWLNCPKSIMCKKIEHALKEKDLLFRAY
jgi:hypothetical protein